jgi:hypothetical protein
MAERERLKKRDNHYEPVELHGEVRAADLDDRRFSLRLDDGTRIVAPFRPDQEQAITEALSQYATRRLRLNGRGELARNRKVKRLASVESVIVEVVDETNSHRKGSRSGKSREISSRVSRHEWSKVPRDGAKNLDHYLYGAPKEE